MTDEETIEAPDQAEVRRQAREKRLAKHRATVEARGLEHGWLILHSTTLNGRHVEQNTEIHIRGEYGRFLFVNHVLTDAGKEWITVLSPSGGGFRSFHPDRVRTVHRINKTRVNAGEESE